MVKLFKLGASVGVNQIWRRIQKNRAWNSFINVLGNPSLLPRQDHAYAYLNVVAYLNIEGEIDL